MGRIPSTLILETDTTLETDVELIPTFAIYQLWASYIIFLEMLYFHVQRLKYKRVPYLYCAWPVVDPY